MDVVLVVRVRRAVGDHRELDRLVRIDHERQAVRGERLVVGRDEHRQTGLRIDGRPSGRPEHVLDPGIQSDRKSERWRRVRARPSRGPQEHRLPVVRLEWVAVGRGEHRGRFANGACRELHASGVGQSPTRCRDDGPVEPRRARAGRCRHPESRHVRWRIDGDVERRSRDLDDGCADRVGAARLLERSHVAGCREIRADVAQRDHAVCTCQLRKGPRTDRRREIRRVVRDGDWPDGCRADVRGRQLRSGEVVIAPRPDGEQPE